MKYQSQIYKSEEGKKIMLELYDRQLATIPVPFSQKYLETRFGTTHLIMYGNPDGVPVLGFHGGNSTNPYSLRPLVKHVDMNKIKFIVPDTIGNIGYSAENKLSSANDDYGKWAADLIDELGFDKVAVLGASYGGGIAVRLATYAPEKISKLMLIVPSGIANANMFQMMKIGVPTLNYMFFPSSDDKLRKAVSRMAPELNDDFLETIKLSVLNTKFEMVMPRNATSKELANLTAPTYIMTEEKDCLFPGEKVIKRAKKIFPNLVKTELLHFGGHGAFMLNEEKHHALYDEITNFFVEN